MAATHVLGRDVFTRRAGRQRRIIAIDRDLHPTVEELEFRAIFFVETRVDLVPLLVPIP